MSNVLKKIKLLSESLYKFQFPYQMDQQAGHPLGPLTDVDMHVGARFNALSDKSRKRRKKPTYHIL